MYYIAFLQMLGQTMVIQGYEKPEALPHKHVVWFDNEYDRLRAYYIITNPVLLELYDACGLATLLRKALDRN